MSPQARSSAAITGVGAVCPLGLNLPAIWKSVLESQTCLHAGLGRFSADQLVQIKSHCKTDLNSLVAGLATIAAREAMRDAGWGELNSDDGIILATTTGDIQSWEENLISGFRSGDFAQFLSGGGMTTPGRSLDHLKRSLNFNGPSLLVTSACSAATQALALAATWVASGRVSRCLVGGSEVLTRLSVEGFRCLGLLSDDLPRPFDTRRSGINLSEAAAFFCVEKSENARAKCWIRGFAMNSDAHHLTAPHPDGWGTQQVLASAIKRAGLVADQIDWVHAHGTASPANDRAEAAALRAVFGDRVPVTSTKAYHGHSLGASGALESAICMKALEDQLVLKTLGCDNPDAELGIRLQEAHAPKRLKNIVKNSLGFGGVNAALVLSLETPGA